MTALTLEPFGSCWTQVFKEKRGTWLTGPPVPVATLKKAGDTATLSIGPDETLYVLARRRANSRILNLYRWIRQAAWRPSWCFRQDTP